MLHTNHTEHMNFPPCRRPWHEILYMPTQNVSRLSFIYTELISFSLFVLCMLCVCTCVLDGPCAPCRCLWSLPRDFPDCGDGCREPRDLVAPLSCDWPHSCWHGDHFHHQRCVCMCVCQVSHVLSVYIWSMYMIWTIEEYLSNISLFLFVFFNSRKLLTW